ncbi:sulfurtransferase TusA family protein [Kiloniella sp.]|uniref:sulfurtransferase TusA family protein n=1 Tax=Kiloniella sp. TaxID=1938587 RepID=UPI003B025179
MAEHLLDATGLKCPIPVLRARKAMKPLTPGEVLEVHATDPSALMDFKNFCETTGHEFLSSEEGSDDVLVLKIKKSD